jgi:hypothetical protein
LAQHKGDNSKWAVKIIKKAQLDAEDMEGLQTEVHSPLFLFSATSFSCFRDNRLCFRDVLSLFSGICFLCFRDILCLSQPEYCRGQPLAHV